MLNPTRRFLSRDGGLDTFVFAKASTQRKIRPLYKLASSSLSVISSVRIWGVVINW